MSFLPGCGELSARDGGVLARTYGVGGEGEVLGWWEGGWCLPRPPLLESACWAGVASLLLLLVAMAAPYWLVSWPDTDSPFVRLGPWEACFYRCTTLLPPSNLSCRFRFPRFQFDHLFTGCHRVWGHEYRLIRCNQSNHPIPSNHSGFANIYNIYKGAKSKTDTWRPLGFFIG